MLHIPIGRFILASVIAGILGYTGFNLSTQPTAPVADITLSTSQSVLKTDDVFTVDVYTSAKRPVNVFKGLIRFDPDIIHVTKIDYNTSLADLWAEEPWYQNGDGTLGFIGGTTRQGGFTGKELLFTITFTAAAEGDTSLALSDIEILYHDGLGTSAPIATPIDVFFTVRDEPQITEVMQKTTTKVPAVVVLPETKSTDLNGDGVRSIADTSIFMRHLTTQDLRSDFNNDGTVNMADASILLQAK